MRALHPELEAILTCPKCRGLVEVAESTRELVCPGCQLAFPIRGGLPVMLVEEARPLRDPR